MADSVRAELLLCGGEDQLNAFKIQFSVNGAGLIQQPEMVPIYDAARLNVSFRRRIRSCLAESSQYFIIRHCQVVRQGSRKPVSLKPFLEEFLEMDIVDAPNWVKVKLRVHKVPRPKERFRSLQSTERNAKFGFV